MNERLRVGIVGADATGQGWGPLAHFPALASLPDYEIVALCTSRPETAKAAARRYGIAHAYHDVRDMVANPEIDVVTVAVRAPNHYDVTMAALEAGKHVYCEWPLAADTKQAEAMAALARARGVRAVVGLQARRDPTLRYVRDLIAQGHIGEVLAATMTMLSSNAPERARSKQWETQVSGGISALTVRGMHSLEAVCMCVGELRELNAIASTQVKRWRVSGTDEFMDVHVPDSVIVGGTLRSGAVLSAHIATMPCATTGFRMEIHGSEGALHVSTSGAPQRDANRLVGAKGRGKLEPMEVPARYVEVPADTPAGPPHNVAHLYLRLAQAIRSNADVHPSFDDGVRRHHLIDAITRASQARTTIAAPD